MHLHAWSLSNKNKIVIIASLITLPSNYKIATELLTKYFLPVIIAIRYFCWLFST
jgi:hypothetical protein